MVEMQDMVPGKRFDRYHELGQHAFGKKLRLWIAVPQQHIIEVGVDIIYMATGGKSLKKVHDLVYTYSCGILVLLIFPDLFIRNYSTIAWTASLHKGVQANVQYGYKCKSTVGIVFSFFSALGNVAFSYTGHNVVLEIQATIPSTPEQPLKKPM
ncbi:hypothetical protein GIB67_018252 [Kingdonia uniflora]|uniref:Amino acid transporter transmembrane domain-containing protein n=1 Tax=Kingdonia uniflora TaxID=39325 RepID=A0A7J7LF18_9MAGN|nr:hypothetical protein GIB67_018252 [Kingdonia uniflora]